jgi:FkbH-like protein/FkbM family methyltransferase
MQRQSGNRIATQASPLLGRPLSSVDESHHWEVELKLASFPFLNDHRIKDMAVLPGAFYVEMAVAAATVFLREQPRQLKEISFHRILTLSESGMQSLRATLARGEDDDLSFRVYGRAEGLSQPDTAETLYASIKVTIPSFDDLSQPNEATTPEEIRARCPQELKGDAFYAALRNHGNQYGPSFQGIEQLWQGEGEALGLLRVPEQFEGAFEGHGLHPVLLDAAAQLVLATASLDDNQTYLLTGFEQISLYSSTGRKVWADAQLRSPAQERRDTLSGDVRLFDETGQTTAEIRGVRFKHLPATTQANALAEPAPMTIAVAATFTAEPLEDSLALWMKEFGIPAGILFAPYNQLFQQLLDPASLLSRNREGFNVTLLRLEDLLRDKHNLRANIDPLEKELVFGEHPRHLLPGGLEIAHLTTYETEFLYDEIFTEQIYLKHGIKLLDGDCVVDVGANIGLFTLFVQQRCRDACVYAFEPSPLAFQALKLNTSLYCSNVKIFNCGLSGRDGEAPFTFYRKSSVFSGYHADAQADRAALKTIVRNMLRKHSAAESVGFQDLSDEMLAGRLESETFICPVKKLSTLIREEQLERIDLLKIDAEKSELGILRGLQDEDWKLIRQLVVEVHTNAGTSLEEITSLLEEKGFALDVEEGELLQDSGFYNIYARRSAEDIAAAAAEARPLGTDARIKSGTDEHLKSSVMDFVAAVSAIQRRSQALHFIAVCPASPTALEQPARRSLFQQMERLLASELEHLRNVHLIKSEDVLTVYPVSEYYDSHGQELGHVPYTAGFFTALGTLIARKYHAVQRAPYKVVVLDCDQTLWQGVSGEDGPLGIELDPAREQLQRFMVEQHDAGMLLCLCSKNNEEDVAAVFQHHPEMPLKLEHFISRRINWKPKSENLKALAGELQLSLSSFIVIEDNVIECAEIEAHCPEVLTLQLPAEAEQIPKFLQHVWAFDRLEITGEDKRRTQLYRQNIRREDFKQSALTFGAFYAGLGLQVRVNGAAAHHLGRVAQLTQRTNQFNFTTLKRHEAELQELLRSKILEGFIVEVSDRFGDYGLVGSMLFRCLPEAMVVDTFVLSCRALGKGVEHRMLSWLGQTAIERGLQHVMIPFLPTGKNRPALDFLQNVGSKFGDSAGERLTSLLPHAPLADPPAGFLFKLPAVYCAGLSFDPEAQANRTSAQDAQTIRTDDTAGATDFKTRSDVDLRGVALLRRIAAELRDVEQILALLKTQKQRQRPNVNDGFIAPNNDLERTIASVWQDVLGIEEVGINDNFFELGGTSLGAVLVASELESRLGIDISTLNLFDKTTISSMAEMLKFEAEDKWEEKVASRRERGEKRRARSSARRHRTKLTPTPVD